MLLLATLMLCAMASPDDLMLLLTTWSLRYATGGVFSGGPAHASIRQIRGMAVERHHRPRLLGSAEHTIP